MRLSYFYTYITWVNIIVKMFVRIDIVICKVRIDNEFLTNSFNSAISTISVFRIVSTITKCTYLFILISILFMCIDIDLVNNFVFTFLFQTFGKYSQTGFNEFISCGSNEISEKQWIIFDFNNISIRHTLKNQFSGFNEKSFCKFVLSIQR